MITCYVCQLLTLFGILPGFFHPRIYLFRACLGNKWWTLLLNWRSLIMAWRIGDNACTHTRSGVVLRLCTCQILRCTHAAPIHVTGRPARRLRVHGLCRIFPISEVLRIITISVYWRIIVITRIYISLVIERFLHVCASEIYCIVTRSWHPNGIALQPWSRDKQYNQW